jgi:hypothetical protein
VNGTTVTINAIEVHQSQGALTHAAADFYQVVYPTDHSLWPGTPQCNPCDHQGNGIDPTDFHDHVLDSVPGTGHGEFNPLWHVFLIVPLSNSEADQEAYVDRGLRRGRETELREPVLHVEVEPVVRDNPVLHRRDVALVAPHTPARRGNGLAVRPRH